MAKLNGRDGMSCSAHGISESYHPLIISGKINALSVAFKIRLVLFVGSYCIDIYRAVSGSSGFVQFS